MSTKHVFTSPDGLVLKSLRGAVALNPSLRLHVSSKSVYDAYASSPVAVVSGGGAGHEPAHASYTGAGMLAASVSGDIFASPSANQVLATILIAAASTSTPPSPRRDVLLVINNYTGDRLNFGIAAEKARGHGVHIESVVVADDVSLLDRSSLVGPRGLGGNILVCKILGAAARRGDTLSELKRLGDVVTANLASIGVGLQHCHVPGRSGNINEGLSDQECELGLGLHNEPGVRKIPLDGCEGLVREMIGRLLASKACKGEGTHDFVHCDDGAVDDVVLFVNNLGGMSQLEMGAILDEVISQFESTSIYPVRVYMSSYMTSLNAPGFSLSLLNLSSIGRQLTAPPTPSNIDIFSLLDAPTDALAWVGVRTHWAASGAHRDRAAEELAADNLLLSLTSHSSLSSTDSSSLESSASAEQEWERVGISPNAVTQGIKEACTGVLAAEADMTHFDTVAGDGDCGATFAAGAKAVTAALDTGDLKVSKMTGAELITKMGVILENSMGGTSGALFGLYFAALANALSVTSTSAPPASMTWHTAPLAALDALGAHTPARPGDRTLVDALHPFCQALVSDTDGGSAGLGAAVRAARAGAEGTRGMRARLGRAAYVGEDEWDGGGKGVGEGVPDPGAWGVAAILEGFARGLGLSDS